MNVVERDLGAIAELALAASDLGEFERGWLEYLKPSIGFESCCSVWSEPSGAVRDVTSLGYDAAALRERFPGYMGELSPQELRGFSDANPAVDLDVVSAARRERLLVYRELLGPHGIRSFVTNVWWAPWGVFGFHLGRAGGPRFTARETQRLRLLAPCVKLGQGLFAKQPPQVGDPDAEWWADEWSLSAREREVSRLVLRGFRNPEIAALLRVSPHTVRNQLVSIFRKADVSSRTELVFTMVSPPDRARRARERRSRNTWYAFLAQGAPTQPASRP